MEVGAHNVSRETIDKLRTFEALVIKWNPKINLVSKTSLSELWERHIIDSAQIYGQAPKDGLWADFGSGGGFPGIVLAALSQGDDANHRFVLVESDQRKCAFLRTAARELDLDIKVFSERIENLEPLAADVVSARALSDLSTLLGFAYIHMAPAGICLFPKGATWKKEHHDAQKTWSYSWEAIRSSTNPDAAILKIQDLVRD